MHRGAVRASSVDQPAARAHVRTSGGGRWRRARSAPPRVVGKARV